MSTADFPKTHEEIRELTWAWWVLLLVGALSIAAGVIVLVKPSHSLDTLAVICGVFILLASISELLIALFAERGAAAALFGVLGIVIGILLIRHPTHGVLAVALLIGIWLIAIGVIRLVSAFSLEHRLWSVIVGLVEIVAGIVIVASPKIGYATLALLIGIAFILNGLSMLALGWVMHRVRKEAPELLVEEPDRTGSGLGGPGGSP